MAKTYADTVKEELLGVTGSGDHCRLTEAGAIIRLTGAKDASDPGSLIVSENGAAVRKVFTLLTKAFNINVVLSERPGTRRGRPVTSLSVPDPKEFRKVMQAVRRYEKPVRDCCIRAYLRGAFLVCGTVSDPEKSYRLEFITTDGNAETLMGYLAVSGLEAKCVRRRGNMIVYLQDAAGVADMLGVLGAKRMYLELENTRVIREVRGGINRKLNCETANIRKTVGASIRQAEEIRLIDETVGIGSLPPPLAEMANLRMQYPDESLTELGLRAHPPVGRSGVNHRFRRISEIADGLRGQTARQSGASVEGKGVIE